MRVAARHAVGDRPLRDLRADAAARVERGVGVLEHHLHELRGVAPRSSRSGDAADHAPGRHRCRASRTTQRASVDLPEPLSPTTAEGRAAAQRQRHASSARTGLRRRNRPPAGDRSWSRPRTSSTVSGEQRRVAPARAAPARRRAARGCSRAAGRSAPRARCLPRPHGRGASPRRGRRSRRRRRNHG